MTLGGEPSPEIIWEDSLRFARELLELWNFLVKYLVGQLALQLILTAAVHIENRLWNFLWRVTGWKSREPRIEKAGMAFLRTLSALGHIFAAVALVETIPVFDIFSSGLLSFKATYAITILLVAIMVLTLVLCAAVWIITLFTSNAKALRGSTTKNANAKDH